MKISAESNLQNIILNLVNTAILIMNLTQYYLFPAHSPPNPVSNKHLRDAAE